MKTKLFAYNNFLEMLYHNAGRKIRNDYKQYWRDAVNKAFIEAETFDEIKKIRSSCPHFYENSSIKVENIGGGFFDVRLKCYICGLVKPPRSFNND